MASLVRKLSGSVALHAYVRRLSAHQVLRLINEIGFDDAQEIVAALSTDQFRKVMAEVLWTREAAGKETLDAIEFARWLALWQQDGGAMVCRRVLELDEDLVVACIRSLINVSDCTQRIAGVGEIAIGTFSVTPRSREAWPQVAEALTALWGEEPDFLLRVLQRCETGIDRLNEGQDRADCHDALLEDLATGRLTDRTRIGHVDALDATMFLIAAKNLSSR